MVRLVKSLLIFLITVGSVTGIHAQTESSDTIIIIEDYYVSGGTRFLPIDTLTGPYYPRRAMEVRGNIEYDITGNIPDSLSTAIEEAVDTWNKCLAGAYANLCFEYTSGISADIQTELLYRSGVVDKTTYYTQSLHRHLFHENDYQTYDAIIKINAQEDWFIGISDHVVSKKNLSYAVKRAIALALGFGSSIHKNNRGNIVFSLNNGHSAGDKMIFNSTGTYLSSIPNSRQRSSSDIIIFVTGNNLYINQQDSEHGLYAPSSFNEFKSLKYLTNPNSIMYYGDSEILSHDIDATTIDVLETLGWTFNTSNNIEIIGENIDSTGVTTAYTSHRFYLSPNDNNLTNRHWEFRVALNNGLYQTISAATSPDFTIPTVQDANTYKHTIDGCLLGEIIFTGNLNGEDITLRYQLTLQLRPYILTVDCFSVTPSQINPNNYDINIGVKYAGSYWLTASARERGTSIAYTYHSNKPYYANMTLSNIRLWDETYVTVSATNQYGTETYAITIPSEDELEARSVGNEYNLSNKEDKLKIVNVTLSYGSFNYSYNDFDDTKGTIRFECQDMNRLLVEHWRPTESTFAPEVYYETDYVQIADNVVEISIDDWWWNDYFILRAYLNDGKGKLVSDTILVNKYLTIEDPDIRTALGLPMSVSEINQSCTLIIKRNGTYLEACLGDESVISLTLYSMTGSSLVRSSKCNRMNVGRLPHGIYLLHVTDNRNNKQIKKILL